MCEYMCTHNDYPGYPRPELIIYNGTDILTQQKGIFNIPRVPGVYKCVAIQNGSTKVEKYTQVTDGR